MTPRYLPYATTPARLLAQLISDLVVIAWTSVWVLVGMAVHSAVSTFAEFGRQVEGGANGIAGNLDSAGHGANSVPFIGDTLSKPLTAAGDAARDIAGAGHTLGVTASWLAFMPTHSERRTLDKLAARAEQSKVAFFQGVQARFDAAVLLLLARAIAHPALG